MKNCLEYAALLDSFVDGELTAEDVAKITDITVTETGFSANGIKIMAAN